MTTIEKRVLDALLELESAVRAMPTADAKPNLLPLFARIDALTHQLPPETDSRLVHYLRKQSYAKARRWLEGLDNQNAVGSCRND